MESSLSDKWNEFLNRCVECEIRGEAGSYHLTGMHYDPANHIIRVYSKCTFDNEFDEEMVELGERFANELMLRVNRAFYVNNVALPESMMQYHDGFLLPVERKQTVRKVSWYSVKVLEAVWIATKIPKAEG